MANALTGSGRLSGTGLAEAVGAGEATGSTVEQPPSTTATATKATSPSPNRE